MKAAAPIRTFSSREFAHELARVKRAASEGTVLITDRGQPKYALMPIEQYWDMKGQKAPGLSLLEAMQTLPSTAGIDFEVPARMSAVNPADLD
jgi:hypothetical protein